ncbi:F0F1 ATP synthase subunit gamma [Helicobacter monodelphidis]|uniref:ATP synthase F1 subunit gamma n=1 Tax=Helicobacter sp. 15-1451 TaxID=2004995 RepID=UPI000DCDC929|nr:ATP synthase F1 subunit gamma [Helicobacter sp. 15-1451]RAX56929.1 F0F1 ATP synthase subunit gamma [Helicobacter sp. 15-1451]
MGNNLKEIRTQITSVKNTQKITKAMKLVSTSKLKKADEMAKRSRLYAKRIMEVFQEIHERIEKSGTGSLDGPFFTTRETQAKKVDIIFITADKGLCGGFNSTTIKEVLKVMASYKAKGVKVRLRAIGKKGIAYFDFNGVELLDRVVDLSSTPNYESSSAFVNKAVKDFLDGVVDEIVLIYNGFKNMISQELRVQQLLPVAHPKPQQEENHLVAPPMEIEPEDGEVEILNQLAKKYIEFSMYYALVDSLAAEHSARMQAMDSATNNAGELVKTRTIAYNKARQEAITTELVEINTGVESMK